MHKKCIHISNATPINSLLDHNILHWIRSPSFDKPYHLSRTPVSCHPQRPQAELVHIEMRCSDKPQIKLHQLTVWPALNILITWGIHQFNSTDIITPQFKFAVEYFYTWHSAADERALCPLTTTQCRVQLNKFRPDNSNTTMHQRETTTTNCQWPTLPAMR